MMATLLSLPTEIIFDILQRLQLRDIIFVCNSCRSLRESTRFDKFFWLLDDFEGVKPPREEALRNAGTFVLSHMLLHQLQTSGEWDREASEVLVQHGASLSRVPSGAYLEAAFREQGPSEEVKFILANGGSFNDVPSGIHELLSDVFQDQGVGPDVDFLLEHGASFHQIREVDELFADTYYDGPSDELDLLEEAGLKMRTLPSEMYQLYQDFWFQDGDGMSLQDGDRGSLERAVDILCRLEKDTPEAIPLQLANICEKYSIVSVRMIIEENPSWSLRSIPGGVDRLLQERYESLATKEIVFLLEQGASLSKTSLDKDQLLLDALDSLGPGSAVEFLLGQGASFDIADGGVNGVLEREYGAAGCTHTVEYLIQEHGAKIELVPSGMEKLLETTVLNLGFEAMATTALIDRYGLSLQKVPCGLPQLIVRRVEFSRSTKLTDELRDCVMLLKDDQQALDLILQSAFKVGGQDIELTHLLLGLGASLKRAPAGVGALLEAIFRRKGHCDDLEYLMYQTGVSMPAVPCGINTLLQEEILNGDRNPTTASLTNAEFLLDSGATLDEVPMGSHEVLRQILSRFGKGTRSQWLERHGAVLRPTQDV